MTIRQSILSVGGDSWSGRIFIIPALLFALTATACRGEKLPDPSSKEYADMVRAFYVGLAAMQSADDARAESQLSRATEIVPQEPAAWANLGLLSLRQRNFDAAAARLEKARELAPDNSRIYVLLGLLESNRGRLPEAIAHLRRAIELDPNNLKAIYTLSQEIERQGGEENEAEAQRLLERILESQPDNLAVLLELTRLAAKRGDADTLRKAVARLSEKSASWPAEAQEQFAAVKTAAESGNPRAAATRVAFLKNVLVRVPEYRQSLAAVKTPREEIGEVFTRFLKLPSPPATPAPPDDALAFTAEPLPVAGKWSWAGAISLNGEGAPVVVAANAREVSVGGATTLPFPGGVTAPEPGPYAVAGLDINYDFKTDLVLAGAGGIRIFRQESPNKFTNVTANAALPPTVTNAASVGAWAADIEMDGDLDIIVGAQDGPPVALRNNGNGTFKEMRPFAGASALRQFCWADLDEDGDPDAALLDAQGRLQFFTNERATDFRERALPQNLTRVSATNIADIDSDGRLDLLALQAGAIWRISDKNEGTDWDVVEVAGNATPDDSPPIGAIRLLAADLDNNGGLDAIAAGPGGAAAWLNDTQWKLNPLAAALNARIFSIADLTGDGRLDLVGVSDTGQPVRLTNKGTKAYHWQNLRPRAKEATGDQRINSFGIGGEMELRAGLLYQKQVITSPLLHFGLGERTATDVVRIVWPNGSIQAEFDLPSDQTVLAEQRLKGSCPSLFAFDGTGMKFVKDCAPWSSAIGLRINAQDTAGILQPQEWNKIPGRQLVPRDGYYDLRITAELWETYYIDHYSLLVVDHPAGTEIFVDEKFSVPPPKLAIETTAKPRPFARALDDAGQDVTGIVYALDNRYLDTFGRGTHQGVTRDHYVELELPEDAPRAGALWLVAHGWLHPTDATVNVSIGQSGNAPPRSLSIEVPDAQGNWVVAKSNLGFPAGKYKTILLDLNGVFRPGAARSLRLRTNMEIYWDQLEWAVGLPAAALKTERLNPDVAELRYRGFSRMTQADKSSPETPDYDRLETTTQKWRDLTGYYTRHGDIRELLAQIDDRIVIVNAGDEMAFLFKAPPPPPAGWVRDFVLIGDGWIKDGDYNSEFSQTVLPLPVHGKSQYKTLPARLEDDPAYRRNWRDWLEYHTRYVTPERFRNALRVSTNGHE
ncbi:MAG TPA: FG-GAP-like repeat-containing protein [Blastocatellia bacterium]|nr:FG-GAP-like repeat-containing protein [Blastocatellia bacterium]